MSLGLTKTQAFNMSRRGFTHHVTVPVTRAKGNLEGVKYIQTPIEPEGVSLYSFERPEDAVEFAEKFNGTALVI